MNTKHCNGCSVTKALGDFGRDVHSPDFRARRCRVCVSEHGKRYRDSLTEEQREARRAQERARARDPERSARSQRRSVLKKRYGITEEEYAFLLAKQGGSCAICGSDEAKGAGKNLSVDHNHRSGAIRGILCQPCNLSLAFMKDSPDLLRLAADYLEVCER